MNHFFFVAKNLAIAIEGRFGNLLCCAKYQKTCCSSKSYKLNVSVVTIIHDQR